MENLTNSELARNEILAVLEKYGVKIELFTYYDYPPRIDITSKGDEDDISTLDVPNIFVDV